MALQIFLFTILQFTLIGWATRGFRLWLQRRSPAAQERALFKKRLPNFIKNFEAFSFPIFLLAILLGSFFLTAELHSALHPEPASNLAIGLSLIPELLLAPILAMLAINCIEWLIPAMRRGNNKAAEGLPAASFHEMTWGFLRILQWVGPICLASIFLGLFLK